MASKESPNDDTIARKARQDENFATIALTWFIQVIGVAAAIIFGLFSVLSWTDSQTAKTRAETANLLAFVALRGGPNANLAMQGLCDTFSAAAVPSLSAAIQSMLPTPAAGSMWLPSTSSISSTLSNCSPSSIVTVTSYSTVTSVPTLSEVPSTSQQVSTSVVTSRAAGSATSSAATTWSTPAPLQTSGSASGHHSSLNTSDKIGVAVGVGIGVPTLVITSLTYFIHGRQRRRR